MKPRVLFVTILAVALFVFSSGASAMNNIRISIAGDSTAATWTDPHPERGWGQYLGECFDREIQIDNLAKPGASTKTFLRDGLWVKAVASRPKYILIQFGHNDSHTSDHPEHTDADGLYSELLRRFVKDARAAGAVPVLLTPVQRRSTVDTLLPYAAAVRRVANETHTPLVDLHELSGKLYAELGASAQTELGATQTDHAHFNQSGARRIARLVAQGLIQAVPELRPHLIK